MNWVTVIWSVASGAALVLAGLHFLVWCRDRQARASLVFALTVASIVAVAVCEQGLMFSSTPEIFGRWLRWMHLPAFVAITASVVFVRMYLGTGRPVLALATVGLRLVSLVLNFFQLPNINFREIRSLETVRFLGQDVAITGEAVTNRWMWLAQASFALWLVYTVDATVTLWRRGSREERRRALVIGGNMSLFILIGMSHTVLTLNGVFRSPVLPSIAFGLMTVAMGCELSRDVLRASRLEHDLQESEQRLSLAASAAGIGLWEWEVARDRIWISPEGRQFYGVKAGETFDFQRFSEALHPDDRARVGCAVEAALAGPRALFRGVPRGAGGRRAALGRRHRSGRVRRAGAGRNCCVGCPPTSPGGGRRKASSTSSASSLPTRYG